MTLKVGHWGREEKSGVPWRGLGSCGGRSNGSRAPSPVHKTRERERGARVSRDQSGGVDRTGQKQRKPGSAMLCMYMDYDLCV